MKTTCIEHPANEPIVLIRCWQYKVTGDHCAGALLAYFEYWHNWKLNCVEKGKVTNAVAEQHGDKGGHDVSLYQFHSYDAMKAELLGLYSEDKIRKSLRLLAELKVITEHRNPNPRYKFDNTKHFLFYPEVAQKLIDKYKKDGSESLGKPQPSPKKRERMPNNRGTISEITSEITSEIDKEEKEEEPSADSFQMPRGSTEYTPGKCEELALRPALQDSQAREDVEQVIDILEYGFGGKPFDLPDKKRIEKLFKKSAITVAWANAFVWAKQIFDSDRELWQAQVKFFPYTPAKLIQHPDDTNAGIAMIAETQMEELMESETKFDPRECAVQLRAGIGYAESYKGQWTQESQSYVVQGGFAPDCNGERQKAPAWLILLASKRAGFFPKRVKEIHKHTALSELRYHPEILKADGIEVTDSELLEMFDCDYQSLVREAEHSTALLEQQLRELETYHEATSAYDAALSV